MKKITVIGSTGMIGVPVTKELIKAGFDVTLLVRNIEKAKKIFGSGINYVKGDLNDKISIAESLKEADGLYVNISTKATDKESEFNPETDGLDNILSVAKELRIKQVAYLSSFLARNYKGDWWVMKAKNKSIQKVKNSGLNYTIFYPSNFMENFENGFVRGNKMTIMGNPKEKAWWISGEDFGRTVVAAFNLEKAKNREYPVQGLEALTIGEACQIAVENYAKQKLTLSHAPMGLFKFLAIFVGELKFVTKLMDVMYANKEPFESQKTWDELSKPAVTIEKYVKNLK
ncbi:MAG: NAD(P)H-binding protein [Bacteroidales bacterium]|nr:NAD(P)H-binding protein [Bacteroidales bacterium]